MGQRATDIGRVRELNRGLVLRELQGLGRATRARLAKETGLTHATVSAIVSELVEDGWVREIGIRAVPRGRPPMQLEIDTEKHFFVGLQIGPENTRVVVLDALDRILAMRETRTRSIEAETVCSESARLVSETLDQAGVDQRRVDAVGVCVPGPVDSAAGLAADVPGFGWQNEPIKPFLANELELRVELYDDAYVLACLELLKGAARESRNAVLLSVTREPVAVLIIEGKIHRGANGFAGAIGHMQMPGLSDPCRCGNVGCLATAASQDGLVTRTEKLLRSGSTGIDPARFEEFPGLALIEAAGEGSPEAIETLNEVGVHLSRATGWILNLLNPDTLILGGALSLLPEPVVRPFRERVLGACHPAIAAEIRIEKSAFGGADRPRAAGLVALHESLEHLDSLFHDPAATAAASEVLEARP
jgi:predicted NBD/HSP70 family sugar kinase